MDSLDKKNIFTLNNCPLCNAESKVLEKVKTINPNSNEILNLRECLSCQHWWIDPIPRQSYLSKLYEVSSEFITNKGCSETCTLPNKDIAKYASRFLNNIKDTKKLNYLEVGVGSGKLFNFLKDRFNISYGIDPAKWRPLEKNIFKNIEDLPSDIKFDVIILQDVLEHLESPIKVLKKLKILSNKGAVIGMCFPNKDSIIAKIQKGRWSMVRPIGHLHFFSSKSIDKLLKNSGWKLIKKYSYWPAPSAFYYLKYFDFNSNNKFKLVARIIRDLLFRKLLLGKDQWYVIAKC